MDVYGLTGGIGSGKSTVARILEEYGVPVVSADELSRMVVTPGSDGLRAVVAAFGPEILNADGALDRGALAARIFADPSERVRLEKLLHPRIRERFEEVLDALEKVGQHVVVYEVPLLFESNLQDTMTGVIVVSSREDLRIARVCARNNLSADEVRARIGAQMDDKTRESLASFVITNNSDEMALRREVEQMLTTYLKLPIPGRGSPPPRHRGPPRA